MEVSMEFSLFSATRYDTAKDEAGETLQEID